MFTLSRTDLLDLLTTAATVGRNDNAIRDAKTRGDIEAVVERRMQSLLASASCASAVTIEPGMDVDNPTVIHVLNAELRVWEPNPAEGDLGRMYVLEALGATLLVRERQDGTYVHVEDEGVIRAPLLVEVNNGGEQVHGEDGIR